jgi:hypothetical protein
MPAVGSVVLKARYIKPSIPLFYITGVIPGTAGRTHLISLDVYWPVIVDRVLYIASSVSDGNVRGAIYNEGSTADSPEGGTLVVESASTAMGAIQALHPLTISDTALQPGRYWLALQTDSATAKFRSFYSDAGVQCYYYDRSGGYGAMTDPCPTVTAETYPTALSLRVKENLPAGHRL